MKLLNYVSIKEIKSMENVNIITLFQDKMILREPTTKQEKVFITACERHCGTPYRLPNGDIEVCYAKEYMYDVLFELTNSNFVIYIE